MDGVSEPDCIKRLSGRFQFNKAVDIIEMFGGKTFVESILPAVACSSRANGFTLTDEGDLTECLAIRVNRKDGGLVLT